MASQSTQRHAHARFSKLHGCLFGFYSEKEILKLSTVEITELKGLSVLSLGEPNGLHDPRMGTLSNKQQEVCPTCNNDHRYCPGHIGHIRLTVPIYNPNIFKFIDAILTRKCYNCHHLLFDDAVIDLIQHKLQTIDRGYVFNIQSLSDEIHLLQEALTQQMTKKLFVKQSGAKRKKKRHKHKKKRSHKSRHASDSDTDEDDEHGINIVDIASSSDDDDENSGKVDDDSQSQNDASSKPNLDFLDEGIMRGTRQSLLQLRWRLFELVFTKWSPLDQCKTCNCVRILFNRSDHSHIIQRPIGRRKKIYEKSGVKLVNINDSTQNMAVDKDITIPVNDVQKHLEALWSTETFIMKRLFNTHPFKAGSTSMDKSQDNNHLLSDYEMQTDYKQFFVRIIVVPPNRYRPPNFMGNRIAESSQNRQFRNVLKSNIAMRDLIKQINELSCNQLLNKFTKHKSKLQHQQLKQKRHKRAQSQREYSTQSIYDEENDEIDLSGTLSDDDDEDTNDTIKEKHELLTAEGLFAKYQECRKQFIQQWELLQQHYNHLTDGTKNAPLSRGNMVGANKEATGIRQLMEKKQGLFRMFMMGKRVNYAARSVVNPELWIKTNEIGIPQYAAKILTYPEKVQSYNYHELRDAIINGADVWPGANSIITTNNKLISLRHKSLPQRKALARTLLSNMSGSDRAQSTEKNRSAAKPQIVYRHIRNNDIVLVNRQPTLHKVSIMAHRVRVQHKGKVIRMHYANCNSYNADFDGDEINVHFPQSELARSEAYNIAATAKQYISVKDGAPLRGLMQDHVVASVLLTKKDTFITRDEYTQLLFCCQQTWNPAMKIKMEAPTIYKPKRLWSGKQVINSLLNGISGDLAGINMEKKTRTPANAWNGIEENNNNKEEGMLIIRDNYLCSGIIDKSQISDGQSFGLIHAIHQLYGAHATSTFLTSLGQLLSTYLQSHGFSARMEDLILTEQTESTRKDLIRNSFKKSVLRCADAVGYNYNDHKNTKGDKPSLAGVASSMKQFILSDDSAEGKLDAEMRSTLAGITNKVISTCYPFGSKLPFPLNNFQLMILAGAKGSTVNMAQIVSLLGQQELEGHRVPRMISGKTLPCFSAYAPDGRSGGFVTQRFLTGLRPQEYYFHSMAGREGLVDTACKTSRSGYLQRCLVKGLETLHVAYDNTVRDCNENIIQFLYGEDSLDTSKASYLDVSDAKKYSFFAQNKKIIQQQVDKGMFDGNELKLIFDDRDKIINKNALQSDKQKIRKILHGEHQRESDASMDFTAARLFMLKWWKTFKKNESKALEYDPCINIYDPGLYFGSVSEKYYHRIKQFIKTFDSDFTHTHLNKNERFEHEYGINNRDFEDLMKISYASSLVEAGEMVGVLAAQSIGEPSTQMTLNTFHLAGFGDRNVTLGIPRMREILMTEGKGIKTPDMSFWIDSSIEKPMDAAIKLKNALEPLPLSKLLTSRTIQGPHVIMSKNKNYKRIYTIQLTIAVPNALKYVSVERVLRCLQRQFLPTLLQSITKHASSSLNNKIDIDLSQNVKDDEFNVQSVNIDEEKEQKTQTQQQDIDEDDEDDENVEDLDSGKKKNDSDYSGDEEEEELEHHSDEEKESEIDDDDDVLIGMKTTKGAYPSSASELDITSDNDTDNENLKRKKKNGRMPNLVPTTTDDETSDANNINAQLRNTKKKSKKRDFKNNDVLQEELAAKYKCFRSVHIVMDEPRILCSLQIELPLNHEPVLLESLMDSVCRNYAFVRKINNIDAVHIQYDKNGSTQNANGSNWKVIISGFNRSVLKLVDKWVDLSSFESNHIAEILSMYGIEAARQSIINELSSVLGAYGLNVSYRHLSLMADSMTYFGEIRPMTRKSMARSTSPFLRVTYEMAQKFMVDSCLNKDIDNISSASSAIVLGQVAKFGTGIFDIKQDINELIKMQNEQKEQQNQFESYYSDDEEEEEDNYNDDEAY